METMNEFCIEWVRGDSVATITAPMGTALYNKCMKFCQEYDECQQIDELVFHIPVKYVKVSHPRVVSEENRQKQAERLRRLKYTPEAGTAEKWDDGSMVARGGDETI